MTASKVSNNLSKSKAESFDPVNHSKQITLLIYFWEIIVSVQSTQGPSTQLTE